MLYIRIFMLFIMVWNVGCFIIDFYLPLKEKLMGHLGVVLYEYLGEEYPEVLGSILGALKVCYCNWRFGATLKYVVVIIIIIIRNFQSSSFEDSLLIGGLENASLYLSSESSWTKNSLYLSLLSSKWWKFWDVHILVDWLCFVFGKQRWYLVIL